jgi:hypothetical protein
LSNASLTRPDFNCCHGDGSSNEPSLGSIETAAYPKIFEASIASAKAWVYIASVQLLVRRLSCPQHSLYD